MTQANNSEWSDENVVNFNAIKNPCPGNQWAIVYVSFFGDSYIHGPFDSFHDAKEYMIEFAVQGEVVNMIKLWVN